MKSLILTLFVMVSLVALPVVPICSNELPSCEDLDSMAITLDDVAEVLQARGKIDKGSKIDHALGKLVNALAEVGKIEKDDVLKQAITGMGQAWERDQWVVMKDELDNIISRVSTLYSRDCK